MVIIALVQVNYTNLALNICNIRNYFMTPLKVTQEIYISYKNPPVAVAKKLLIWIDVHILIALIILFLHLNEFQLITTKSLWPTSETKRYKRYVY